MITVHHLQNSRSQRILWMLEELRVDYTVKRYERDAETQLAPQELLDIHPLGKSPVIEDGDVRVAESGAIIEYLAGRYGQGSMVPEEGTAARREYIYWLHYAEGSLMTPLLLRLVFERIKTTKMPFFAKPIARGIADKVMSSFVTPNIKRHMQFVDDHLAKNEWFAGNTLTGADVQMSFPLEAASARGVVGEQHANIHQYVQRVQARPAYIAALQKGGPYDYA
ncbi:MAG: glutathione S-transferase [Gammaproteobacteria bacterium]|nr:glutathione S-transferase [Gammaproteobacteria bacterium]